MMQLPAATVPVQVSAPPLTVIVTLPVGEIGSGACGDRLKLTVTAAPVTDGSALAAVIVVGGSGMEIICEAVPFEPLKLVSPAYVAVIVRAPRLVSASEQVPAATVPVQVSAPPLTVIVTLPVG